MDEFAKRIEGEWLKRRKELIKNVSEVISGELLNYARSQTSNIVAGINAGDGVRRTHPGGWADRTSVLVNSMVRRVSIDGDSIVVEFFAGAEYAGELDKKEGYSVFAGIETEFIPRLNKTLTEIFKKPIDIRIKK